MLHLYPPASPTPSGGEDTPPKALQQTMWIDLESPDAAEIAAVEQALTIELPDRPDMMEIEASSRVYQENGASYMTALLVVDVENHRPRAAPFTFILTPGNQLVTVRYDHPHAFRTARENLAKHPSEQNGAQLLLWLLDIIVDRTADILEHMGAEVDRTGSGIFGHQPDRKKQRLSPLALRAMLGDIGKIQFTVNKVHDSLRTLNRIVIFLTQRSNTDGADKSGREALKSLSRDISSLIENSSYLMQNVFFLLDAAVGRISIEQNLIIKILSVASVIFLPPTLVASIYGMNFPHMPELSHKSAYPVILIVMLLSAILPFLWFRRKGWL